MSPSGLLGVRYRDACVLHGPAQLLGAFRFDDRVVEPVTSESGDDVVRSLGRASITDNDNAIAGQVARLWASMPCFVPALRPATVASKLHAVRPGGPIANATLQPAVHEDCTRREAATFEETGRGIARTLQS